MQAAAQHKMAIEQGSGVFKNLESFGFSHTKGLLENCFAGLEQRVRLGIGADGDPQVVPHAPS